MSRQNTIPLRIVYAIALLITGTMALYAQDSVTLNEPVTAVLDGNGPVELAYTVVEPQFVQITAISLESPGVFDTTLEVLGPDGHRLPGGFNDDSALIDGDGSAITELTLPEPGTYIIRINSFNGVTKGRVEVTIEPVDPFGETVNKDAAGWVIRAGLHANTRYTFSFEAADGETLTLTARDTSGTLDPVLTLRGPDGEIITRNDDHAPSAAALLAELDTFDAQIEQFAVPVTGTYTVEVVDFLGREGAFELTIRRVT